MKLTLLFITFLVLCANCSAANVSDKAENEMLRAYSELQYAKAKRIAEKSELPQFKLISAMCDVFDRRAQNLRRGLPALEKLSKSKELPERYRSTAKLAYARAMHTLALRKNLYPEAKKVDPVPVYDEVIAACPAHIDAIYAVIYRTQYLIEKGNIQEAFEFAEKFITNYKGSKRQLYPVHLMLFNEYIRNGKQYKIAIKHAEKARELVPANPKTEYLIHFKIARVYDVYLKDYDRAEKEYVSFLEKHPDNSEAIIAKRYLRELRERKAK